MPGRARVRRRVSAHEYVRATRDPRRAGGPRTWHVNSPTFHNSSKEPVFPPAVRQTPRLPPASGQRGGWGGGRSGARPLVELELGAAAAAAGALANGLTRLAQVRNAEDMNAQYTQGIESQLVYIQRLDLFFSLRLFYFALSSTLPYQSLCRCEQQQLLTTAPQAPVDRSR